MSVNSVRLVFGALLFFSVYPSFGQGTDLPSDTLATKETIRLYQHLKKLPEKGFLFGHQDDLAYGVEWKYEDGRSDVKDVTGDYPALYGSELGRIELDYPADLDGVPFDKTKDYIRQAYGRGGVITISWHLNNPLTGGTAWQPAPGTVAAILPGGAKNALYKGWLDKVAAFLQDLKGPHGEYIPVILRLFHELNGDWFWWGGKNCSPDELKQLWRFTVAYLRDVKGVHHLLYAYNTDRFASEQAYLERYPGDQWVDILGFDIYQAYDIKDNAGFRLMLDKDLGMLDQIAAKKDKVPALTEFGYNGLADSLWWTGTFLPVAAAHKIAYVMAWRNAGAKYNGEFEFYVPYKGQGSAGDFLKFYRDGRTLFQQDLKKEDLYR